MDTVRFFATSILPNPKEVDYWIDLSDNPYGGSIKYYNGTDWVRLAASGGIPDLSKYYTKEQVNIMLNGKADVGDVDSKVDDSEVKDVIKDVQFRTSDPNSTSMVLFKYDGSTDTISMPIASTGMAGIITSLDFIDFVKQHLLLELHTEMIELLADIRAKYQRKLRAGKNIYIDENTDTINATGELSVRWDLVLEKPDFKEVATSGDYNDLINKLKAGKDVNISDDNTITINIDSDQLSSDLNSLNTKIETETTRATNAELANSNKIDKEILDRIADVKSESDRAKEEEKKLQDNLNTGVTSLENAIATELNRALSAEEMISTNLLNEINRSTLIDTTHTSAIAQEVKDRKDAITTEVNDRNEAIKVEKERAEAKEAELDSKITDHTTSVSAALALKADKSDTYTKSQVDAKLSGAYKVKGSRTFENLPATNNVVGDVYNVTNAFTLDGKHFDPGTNVVWTDEGWDALSGSFDTTAIEESIQQVADNLSQEVLDRTNSDTSINNSITAVSNRVTTAEGKLNVINGNDSTTGSIAKALKDAKSYTDSSVTTEKNRAETAELKLAGDLSAEATRAKAAETANTTAILNEEARATDIESALRTDVNNLSSSKVDKVDGKGLSTNDYTTAEKTKLSGIANNANNYTLPKATTTTLGGIIVGDRLSVDGNGKLTATYVYTLPTATSSVLGGVKTGSNITNTSGTISITKANVTSALGVDPTTKYVDLDTNQAISGLKSFSKSITFSTNHIGITNLGTTLGLGNNGIFKVLLASNELRPSTTGVIELGNSVTSWKSVTSSTYISNVATGTAPVLVSSTTLCTNLNADMLDGVLGNSYYKPNGSTVDAGNYNASGDTHVLQLMKIKIDTYYSNYIVAVSSSFWGQQHYSVSLLAISCSNNDNFGNVTPRCNIRVISKMDERSNVRTYRYKIVDNVAYIYVSVYGGNGYGLWNVNVLSGTDSVTGSNESPGKYNGYGNLTIEVLPNLPTSGLALITSSGNSLVNYVEDWYGVSWSENSSSPDCTRIGNMDLHRLLPILEAMRPFLIANVRGPRTGVIYPVTDDFTKTLYSGSTNEQFTLIYTKELNVMVKIPEFWYIDDYVPSTKTHNLKICSHQKPGWHHHKEAFVSAYELYNDNGIAISGKGKLPTVSFTRTNGRTWARANGLEGESKWNLYTYEEHRAICHLFLVEYATRNSLKAVNTSLTVEGYKLGGLGSGCTTGMVNSAYSFIPTGTSDALGSGSGEVIWTDGTNSRKCNRYRGIENPFGHVWKHTDDVISIYDTIDRTWYKSENPSLFSTNKNDSYKPLLTRPLMSGWKKEIACTPTCDFFANSVGGSDSTYWCDYNWDNADTSEHCLIIGGSSGSGSSAGLFYLNSNDGVGRSGAGVGSRLVYLPWAD